MKADKRSVWAVLGALLVIFIGLFLVCSQRRATLLDGEDMAVDDDQFRQELIKMLDLADESELETDQPQLSEEESTDDVLALLLSEDEEEGDQLFQNESQSQAIETSPSVTASSMGLTEEMFVTVRNDVQLLEKRLQNKATSVDSLRRIIGNRNVRLQELEARVSSGSGASNYSRPQTASASSYSSAPASGFMGEYQQARMQFERFDYQGSTQSFLRLLNTYPNHKLSDNCQYWIGECYYGLKQYQKAIMEFQKVFAYNQADKHDDAQIMIAMSYVRVGQRERANSEFESFLNTYTNSEYTSVARRYYKNI